jgi:hypothetical protein
VASVILDSGATFSYVATPGFEALLREVKEAVKPLSPGGRGGGRGGGGGGGWQQDALQVFVRNPGSERLLRARLVAPLLVRAPAAAAAAPV